MRSVVLIRIDLPTSTRKGAEPCDSGGASLGAGLRTLGAQAPAAGWRAEARLERLRMLTAIISRLRVCIFRFSHLRECIAMFSTLKPGLVLRTCSLPSYPLCKPRP